MTDRGRLARLPALRSVVDAKKYFSLGDVGWVAPGESRGKPITAAEQMGFAPLNPSCTWRAIHVKTVGFGCGRISSE